MTEQTALFSEFSTIVLTVLLVKQTVGLPEFLMSMTSSPIKQTASTLVLKTEAVGTSSTTGRTIEL